MLLPGFLRLTIATTAVAAVPHVAEVGSATILTDNILAGISRKMSYECETT